MPIFPGELVKVARSIRELYPTVSYDHRPRLSPYEPDLAWKQSEEFRVGYAGVKWAVAKVLNPHTIREVGVGGGIAALAFLDACPDASYVGVDNGRLSVERGFNFGAHVLGHLQGRQAVIETIDSRLLSSWPKVDLAHVDGCHLFDWAYHDIRLALASGTRWILVDDARDAQVSAAVFRAVLDHRQGPLEWAYFEDTWTGSILVCQDIAR